MIFPCSCHPLCNIPSHTFHSAYASKSSEVFPLTLIRHLYSKLMLLFYCHLREYPWRFRKRNWPGKWPRLFSPKRQSSWNKRDFTDSSAWCWHSLDKKQLPCSFLKEQTHVKIPHIPVWLYVAKLFWCFLFVLYCTTTSMYIMYDTQRCLTVQILFFLTHSSQHSTNCPVWKRPIEIHIYLLLPPSKNNVTCHNVTWQWNAGVAEANVIVQYEME